MSRRRPSRDPTEAEVDLWRRAVADAAPLPGRARVAPAAQRRAPAAAQRQDGPKVPEITSETARPAPRPAARAGKSIDRATLARLKKGRMPIEARIDLHGMTAAAAERNLRAFLRSSQAMGRRAVLVITGRGLDPENLGRGVLKREAPHWLDRMPDLVSGYNDADRRHGGAGALYVRLRRKDKAGGSAP